MKEATRFFPGHVRSKMFCILSSIVFKGHRYVPSCGRIRISKQREERGEEESAYYRENTK